MAPTNLLNNPRLTVSVTPPYDPLMAFVRENHIAKQGSGEGPLKGLVFAAKDVFKVMGSTVGNGHPEWLRTHEPDDFTSSIIVRLLDAGADLVGKTVCDELCFSISGENWNYGCPLNPHDPRRFTGGSSAGSGAATAGGLVDFALGSDCLGSVRIPGAYNGVLCIRPTYRRVPSDGEAPYCASMDVLGFLANSPDTFKKVGRVMLGEDEKPNKVKRLLIAKDCMDSVDKDVVDALQPAIEHIGAALGDVREVTVSKEGLDKWVEIFRIIQGYEVWESYGSWYNKYRPFLNRGPKERLEWASTITRRQYKEAYAQRQAIIDQVDALVEDGGVLCMPTAASVAPLRTASLEEISATRLQSTKMLCISPLSGTPQINLPMIKQHDVPLGLTLIGARGTDLTIVDFAADMVDSFLNK